MDTRISEFTRAFGGNFDGAIINTAYQPTTEGGGESEVVGGEISIEYSGGDGSGVFCVSEGIAGSKETGGTKRSGSRGYN